MISSVPNDLNNSETSIICYKYNTPEVVKILLIYKPLQAGHAVTGNRNVIPDARVRNINS